MGEIYPLSQTAAQLKGYYKVRWEKFIHYLKQQLNDSTRFTQNDLKMSYDRPANDANAFYKKLSRWEEKWCNSHQKYKAQPSGLSFVVAQRLYEKWLPVSEQVE